MEYLFIYGLQMASRIDAVSTTGLVLSIAMIIITVAYFAEESWCITDGESSEHKIFNTLKKTTATIILITTFLAILPTKQTMLLMSGMYLRKKTINNMATSEKLEKVSNIIDLQLDKYIKELKENDN